MTAQGFKEPTTRAEWEALGQALFGDDHTDWVFECPTCKKKLCIKRVRMDFEDKLPQLRAGGFNIEQECIGRYLPGVGCDWAAYGLFRGPWIVDGIPVFRFAMPEGR